MPGKSILAGSVFLLAAAGLAVLAWHLGPSAGQTAPAAAPGSRPVTTAGPGGAPPATVTGRAEMPTTYPSPALVRAADAQARRMLGRLDESFASVTHAPFVVIGNLPERRLRQVARDSVLAPAEALWRGYFQRKPTDVITVLLFRDGESYKLWAKKLFNDTQVPYFGYYKHSVRTMVMNISTGTGTLVHELTHALIAYDFPAVPTWFNEGLASLHEQCYVRPDRLVGDVNWRLPHLQKAIREKKLRPLRELVTRDDFYGRLRGINYAQARYFVMYLQRRGLLKKFYRQFRRHHADQGAVKVIEAVFGARVERVEASYLEWVKTLRWPKP